MFAFIHRFVPCGGFRLLANSRACGGPPLEFNFEVQRARITGEAAIALSQHGTVAPVTLYQRTDFAASMTDGRTVQELDRNSRSAIEVHELWKYVFTQLRKVSP